MPLSKQVRRERGDVWLDSLCQHEVRANQIGNLVACARYLGYGASDAWLAGATAFAFALNVGPDLCPSGPSAWADHKLLPLAENAGLHVKTFFGDQSQPDFVERQREAFARVHDAIDEAMPVIGCSMRTPEVYLVTGYDDEGHYLFIDFETGQTGKLHHAQLGFLWFQFPELGMAADDTTTVRDALNTALDLAEARDFDSSDCGLRAYDNWIEGLADARDSARGFGAAYNAACWSDCRRHAAPFLDEAKRRLDDAGLSPHLDAAIECYRIAAAGLDTVAALFPFAFGEDESMAIRFEDHVRRREAREALAAARSAESAGLEALRSVLKGM
jgi:hypothetical protein